MSYDPTQRVPPPQQPGYTQYPPPQGYPPQPTYPPNYAPPPAPAPAAYQQYASPPPGGAPGAGFDFGRFWNSLQRPGQICVLGGLVLFISLFFNWFSVSVTSSCSGSQECSSFGSEVARAYYSDAPSASGFSIANSGVTFHSTPLESNTPGTVSESYNYPLLWVVILASLALMVLPILVSQRKIAEKQGQLFTLLSAGAALLFEILYVTGLSGALPQARNNISAVNSFFRSSESSLSASISLSTGADIGFWLALIATIAAGGLYAYLTFFNRAGVGYPAPGGYPVAPPTAYPGSQPVAYPGSQSYAPPAYPGSQPYAPPSAYPGSQPYAPPGQYPGQPPYPGQ